MGIDIYQHWNGQTDEERKAQFTGFSVAAGSVGYLREAYHGGPYATRVLAPEAFDDEQWVTLDGKRVIVDGEVVGDWPEAFGSPIKARTLHERLEAAGAAILERYGAVYEMEPSAPEVRMVLESFGAFVALAERKERETGEPVLVYASY